MAKKAKAKAAKAKKKARKTGKVAARTWSAAAAAAPVAGPVTLAEARALARAKRPHLAVAAAVAITTAPQSPAAVGAERQQLKKDRRDERQRRISDYKATMDIMKARGARAPSSRRSRAADTDETGGGPPAVATAAATVGFAPLQILAEGDSWFDYPPFYLTGGGLITRLESSLGVPILNLAKAGDEVRYMLGVEERKVLAQQLTNGSPSGGPWDAVLFSGGGNDVVDNPMALWVRDYNPAVPPATLIHQPRFDAALALVRAGYEDLIALRDKLSPNTHLVFHAYDFPVPDGRGVCGFGPWLKPTFDLRGFPAALTSRQAVINAMLAQFAAMLTALAGPTVTFINGQGTLPQQKASWHNELHPTRAGFDRHAALFYARLKQLFPARVA